MELTPREQIAKATTAFEHECALHKGCNYSYCPDLEKIYARHRAVLAEIVLNAGSKLTHQEKLTYLVGDCYYENRKKIIKEMIEAENIDPKNTMNQQKD